MSKRTIVITTGGTAGHVFPAYTIAKILCTRNNIICLTDKRGRKFFDMDIDTTIQKQKNVSASSQKIKNITLPVTHLSGNICRKLLALVQLCICVVLAMFLLKKHNVSIVIGFGSFASFPALAAAVILRIPIVLHEQNAVVGTVNRMFLKHAEFLATSYHDTLNFDEKYKDKIIFVGNPIRPVIFEIKRRRTRITREIQILITGGSQCAALFDRTIAEAIIDLPPHIRDNLIIFQQVRQDNIEHVEKIYRNNHVMNYTLASFFDDIPQLMIDSDLIISRAGASAISEIQHLQVPSIIIPLANSKDNHQYYNAKALKNTGACLLFTEEVFTRDKLSRELVRIFSDDTLRKMQSAASHAERNNAAQKLAIKINDFIIRMRL